MDEPRALHVIAREIAEDWNPPWYGAVPYIEAMTYLTTMDSAYGNDSARDVVTRFLVNAHYWRGGTARRIKTELREMSRKGNRK